MLPFSQIFLIILAFSSYRVYPKLWSQSIVKRNFQKTTIFLKYERQVSVLKDTLDQSFLLSTGEFAKLCGIKKDTLFYYDRFGILKPHYVSENGYRYYTTVELNRFHSITVLQNAGLSLDEIKEFLTSEDPYSLMGLFKEMHEILEEKARKYARLAAQVRNTLATMEQAKALPYFHPRIESLPSCKLAAIRTNDNRLSDTARTEIISQYYRYCMNNEKRADFFRGGMILQEHLSTPIAGGDYLDYLCIRLDPAQETALFDKSSAEEKVLMEKPAGRYACINCPGGLDNTLLAIRTLQRFIQEQGLTVVGNCYEFEIMGTFTIESESTCIKQIEIQVE